MEKEVLNLAKPMAEILKEAIKIHERRDMVKAEGWTFEDRGELSVKVTVTPQRLSSLYAIFIEAGRIYQDRHPEEKTYFKKKKG